MDKVEHDIKTANAIKRKRKLVELQEKYSDPLSEDSDENEPDLPLILEEYRHLPKLPPKPNNNNKKPPTIIDQYKLAKAQLQYILRENEMLCDEWSTTEAKLKKLQTERRVLLDALVKRGYNNEDE